jgi:hypothetical protein
MGPGTPVSETGVRKYDHLPADIAAYKAWNEAGPHPFWHNQMKARVREEMPVLARALDRLMP